MFGSSALLTKQRLLVRLLELLQRLNKIIRLERVLRIVENCNMSVLIIKHLMMKLCINLSRNPVFMLICGFLVLVYLFSFA
jgi:hypothetical protein